MAGLMTHMAVARELSKSLPEGIIMDMGMFYLGNLAPDAIHVREGYERTLKKHTHFRDDILDREFAKEENRVLFHHRLADFISEYKELNDGLLDLYRGYAVHILVDELYILTIRENFCRTLQKLRIDQDDPIFIEYVINDMIRNDFLLVKNYEGVNEIQRYLKEAPAHPVTGYLYEEEICSCRDWLLDYYLKEQHEILQPKFIQFEDTLDFIRMAAVDIVKRLSDGKDFPRMF